MARRHPARSATAPWPRHLRLLGRDGRANSGRSCFRRVGGVRIEAADRPEMAERGAAPGQTQTSALTNIRHSRLLRNGLATLHLLTDPAAGRGPAFARRRASARQFQRPSFARISRPSAFRCRPGGGERRLGRPSHELQGRHRGDRTPPSRQSRDSPRRRRSGRGADQLGVPLWRELGCDAGAHGAARTRLLIRSTRAAGKHSGAVALLG